MINSLSDLIHVRTSSSLITEGNINHFLIQKIHNPKE